MKKQNKSTPFEELSQIIVTAINDEPFFTKDVLIPKIVAILKGFKASINATKYNKIESPSDAARRLRAIESTNLEMRFWKEKIKEILGGEEYIKPLYDELKDLRIKNGFK